MTLREQAIQFIAENPSYQHVMISREASNKLINLYYAITGEVIDCGGCHDKGSMAYKGIETFIRKDSNQDHFINRKKIVMQFTLNKKAQVYSVTHERFISELNITDEIALSLIAERKENIEYFSGYPENYQELVDEHIKNTPAKEIESVHVETPQEEVTVETKEVEEVNEEVNEETTETPQEEEAPAPATSQNNFKKGKHGKR